MSLAVFTARFILIVAVLCSLGATHAQTRAITPRGPLAADENANIAIF